MQTEKRDAYAALRVADFRRYFSMRLLLTLSIQIMSVSVGYFIYDMTGDPLKLGLAGLAEAIPAISVSLWAGHIADKYSRRHILVACLLLFVTCAISLFVLALNKGKLSPDFLVSAIYVVIFFTGIARGFYSPAGFAFLPQLVSKSVLPNAITWNSSSWEVASITGLGVGGLIYGFGGVELTFGIMACLSLGALFCALSIKPRPVPPVEHMESATIRIKEGLRFVFNNPLIISSVAMDLFAVLFGGAVALLPVFAKDILHVGPQGLGILRAAMSLGAIIMAFVLAYKPLSKNAGRIMLGSVAGFGLCIIGFGLSTSFWLSFFCLFFAGVFDEVSVFIRSALVQFETPEHMKGRVSSVSSIFITTSNEIGAFESGLAARALGTVPSVVFGGCMTLLIVGITWVKAPKLRDLDFSTIFRR